MVHTMAGCFDRHEDDHWIQDRRYERDQERERRRPVPRITPRPQAFAANAATLIADNAARVAAEAARTCTHPDGFVRIDGTVTYEAEGDDPPETHQHVTCLACTASFSRVVEPKVGAQ